MDDTFSAVAAAAGGPLAGLYLWSNAANWSLGGPPADGDGVSVSNTSQSYDDLAALTLASLTLGDDAVLAVTGVSLDVASLAGATGIEIAADAFDAGTPVTVTVGTISGTGGLYGAYGPGAVLVDQSAADPGETYAAEDGGFIELSATPSNSSVLDYYSGLSAAPATFALQNPGAINAVALNNVAPDDVLELPGSSVSAVSFGPGSLSITTNDGSYTFSNVTYQGGQPAGYSAAFDSATGLEAITFLGLDTFTQAAPVTSGPLDNDFLWSNAANWSLGGPPVDGDSVSAVEGVDDLAVLTLASLTVSDDASVYVTGASLDVTSVAGTAGDLLAADASLAGTPVMVTVGTIAGTGGLYEAYGAGADFVDQSTVDPGETYIAESGGFTELSAAPSSSSALEYFGAPATFALRNPDAINAVALIDVAPGDVLELPGSSVSDVSFGPGSLSITTNDGGYTFSNVTWQGGPPTGYSAAFDPATGLEAITFPGLDTFSRISPATSGPLDGYFLWSDAANWSLGAPPIGGGSVAAADGIDDLATLSLASLTLGGGGVVDVTGASLDVTAVYGGAGTGLEADASLAGTPATVTVGTIAGAGGDYGALGAGAVFVDQSTVDPGEAYDAGSGGFTELSATPSSGSTLEYGGAPATFALQNPGATNAFALNNVTPGDVLELPGTSVGNVSFGPNSLNVTTNAGGYAFSNVTWQGGPPTGYRAAFDPVTGLEAITFLGLDVFSQVSQATGGPWANEYLWSNAANWSLGAPPIDGDSVSVTNSNAGFDDLAALSLATLTLSDYGYVNVVGASLDVTSLVEPSGGLQANVPTGGAPVTVTVGTISGFGANGINTAVGAGAVFLDQSAVDIPETYLTNRGGMIELWATPNSNTELGYGSDSTFALRNPAAANALPLRSVAPGDVLEQPGTSVGNVSFGPGSLSITTNDGGYAFTNVTWLHEPPAGYSAAFDTATGLEAITFFTLDTFSRVSAATSGPLAGQYLWSNASNWSLGAPPEDGDTVSTAAGGYDDLTVASAATYLTYLTNLTLTGGGVVTFSDSGLDVTSVTGGSGTVLAADSSFTGMPSDVTVGTIAGTGGSYGGTGAAASFVDQSDVDPGEDYFAHNGGLTELSAAPSSDSSLEYAGAHSTFALVNPGAANAVALINVAPADVLELPGSSVSNVSFGPASLSITTNDGGCAFSDVTWQVAPPTGFSAAFDAYTGLEAITFVGPDTFLPVTAATSGPLAGLFLWSNAANWTLGAPPVNGGNAAAANGIDDLAALTLASLTLGGTGVVEVTGASLDVTSASGVAGAGLVADASLTGTPVTVGVGAITGSGGSYGATGTGAVFVDQSAVDPGEYYLAYAGGFTELSAAPSSGSTLEYGGTGSTFALQNPGATNGFALNNLAPGDVLEVPGSSVSNLGYGPDSLTVTTNDGSYDFSNVSYGGVPLVGYSAAADPATGLEAITFVGPDTFSQVSPATSGPLAGDYLWSNAANWSYGTPPVDGGSVATAAAGYDDLAALTLASLTLGDGAVVDVTGASLDVTSVSGSAGAALAADALIAGISVTVTVGTIARTGGDYGALGAGAVFVNQSAVDPGELYFAEVGGFTELTATPSSSSTLGYGGADSTFALPDPGAANTFALTNLAPGDTLELPGSSASNVSFGTHSLTVTTNDGSYAFSNVAWQDGPPTGYSAAFDPTTGLEAITFLGLDTFSDVSAATSGPLDNDYLWSNAANWSLGAPPIDGDSVNVTEAGYDDLAALTLASLTLSDGSGGPAGVGVIGASLDVTSLYGVLGSQLEAETQTAGTPVTVTVGTIESEMDVGLGAAGPGAVFMDQSTSDPGDFYVAEDGGLTEFSSTPGLGTTLKFVGTPSTFALVNPGTINEFALETVAPHDVLEVPGSSVSNVSFGPDGFFITTNDGSYGFSDVTYASGQLTGYSAAFDPVTGLEAVTLLGPDTFLKGSPATSGPLTGDYLWSNPANWSRGTPPIEGDTVQVATYSYDDLAALSLASLTVNDNTYLEVTGASLDVTSFVTYGSTLEADALYGPVTVTVGTIGGFGSNYDAVGTGAVLVAQAGDGLDQHYGATYGGLVELSGTPDSSATLELFAGGTFALRNPGAANAFLLQDVAPGDVLELPGSSVSDVSFGSSSLTVTTNDGGYAFSNVAWQDGTPTGYSAAFDSTTGLEAITFLGLDTFSEVSAATSGPQAGDYLWSNAANWSLGAPPIDGDSVNVTEPGVDDLAALTLAGLTLSDGSSGPAEVDVIGASLDVTSLYGVLGSQLDAETQTAGTPVTVTVGTIGCEMDVGLGAAGAGAVFMDQSTSDPGDFYVAEDGGLTEFSSTPGLGTTLKFVGTPSTFALLNPEAINEFALETVAQYDVLEVPGSSVSNISFGPANLSITTNDGSYAFSNVTYASGQLTDYSAAVDPATGLEAITFLPTDTFSPVSPATSGALAGDYLWSNAANWSNGAPPVDGDTVIANAGGYDDLAALSLTSLTLNYSISINGIIDGSRVDVIGASLDVGSVTGGDASSLEADAALVGTPVTVTVGGIGGSFIDDYGANGAGAVFVDQSAVDEGNAYDAGNGGITELSATPSSLSALGFGQDGTLALLNPGTVNTFGLNDVAPGDVLELPGSSVSDVSFGPDSLSITTDEGSYAFSKVTYANGPLTAYSAAFDPATGLEAITFLPSDRFSAVDAATGGPLAGKYLWSNASNWSDGVPLDGANVSVTGSAYDDLAALSLASVALNGGGGVNVTGGSLKVTSYTGSDGISLAADEYLAGTPVTVTVGTIQGAGNYGAIGAGAVFVDLSAVDPGANYFTELGGFVELSATPNSGSILGFGADSTFALRNPGTTNAVRLQQVRPNDVLELPGSSVSDVSVEPGSLSITTNDGSYAFSDVNYGVGAITGYRAAYDPTTGLEAITFTGLDTFSQVTPATSGSLDNDYLWSNATNWSFGEPPVDGDSISTGVVAYDDLAALTLASLILSGGGVVNVTGASLNVTSIAGVSGAGLAADAYDTGTPVTVTVGTITGTGGNYGAAGSGAIFMDQSVVDPGATYLAEFGGFTELSAPPSGNSFLEYIGADSTFALRNPGAVNAFALNNVAPGDVLELPGTSLASVTQGPGSLAIVTSLGTTSFSNVTFASLVLTYDAAPDPLTGLQAITFRDATGAFSIAQDVFQENVTSPIGPPGGQYSWSNALNWSAGAPVSGEVAGVDSLGDDDLASLTLGQLIVTGPGAVDVGVGNLIGTENGLINAGTVANAGTISGGVTLAGSGILVNGAGARVSGDVDATAAGETVINLGSVSGAVTLAGGDRLVTGAGAVFGGGITGGTGGNTLEVATGPYTLTNFDAAGTPQYNTLQIDTDVSVTTDTSDLLTGVTLVNDGTLNVSAFEATMAVSNSGEITGDVTLTTGVPLTNNAGGTITGSGLAVIEALGLASVMNAGLIDPATYGVDLTAGGSVTNAAGGTIEGTVAGVLISGGGGTVTNAGLISGGGTDAVTLAAGFANRVILDPGAAFNGIVDGGNTLGAGAVSELELAAASGAGTLTGFNTEFVNFTQLAVDPGASWNFGGGNTLAAGTALTDQGALTLSGTSVAGGGAVTIDATAGLPASATVADAGSWTGNSRFVIGATGGGDLLLDTAGSVSVAAADVAQSAGSSGGITVTGTNSLLNDAGSLVIGDGGLGGLVIQSGGTVIAGTGLTIANQASASGSSVNTAGAGSNLRITGLLDAGVSGFGALSISNGATVSAGSLDAGNSLAAVANINVSDASLIIASSATVADDGTGVLSVLSGATFAAANLTIGSRGDSSGAVVVSGAGSVVDIAGNLNVGTALGTGDLTIGPGGVVNAEVVSLQGQVVLENGELDPTVNLINQGQTAGGSGTIAAGDIVDEGVIQAGGSKPSQKLLVVAGTVLGGGPWTINGTAQAQANSGAGILQINAGGTLEMEGPVLNAGSTTFTDDVVPQSTYTVNNSVVDVNFADATGVLKLDQIAGFAGTIAVFQKGDSFVVTGGTLSGLGVSNGNTLTVGDSGAGHGGTDRIIFASAVNTGALSIVNNNTIQVACFAAGTRIGVEDGQVSVEQLKVGDRVVTADRRVEPIVWVGQRTVNCRAHPEPETVWPVRVAAGAFGRGTPEWDLYLSPDHAVLVNEVLVPVKLLINATSIAQVKRNAVTYYHVELPRHAVILAEGLTVESYLDLGDRANFQREDRTVRLFPDFAARLAPETALAWETRGAAPLVGRRGAGAGPRCSRRARAAAGLRVWRGKRLGKSPGPRPPWMMRDRSGSVWCGASS